MTKVMFQKIMERDMQKSETNLLVDMEFRNRSHAGFSLRRRARAMDTWKWCPGLTLPGQIPAKDPCPPPALSFAPLFVHFLPN